jgi:hypothetical protein
VKDIREFSGTDGRLWQATVQWRGGGGAAAEGAKITPSSRVLRFQTAGEVRIAHHRDDWDQLPDRRLREILEQEATPEAEWA